jgi:hypothetical protein
MTLVDLLIDLIRTQDFEKIEEYTHQLYKSEREKNDEADIISFQIPMIRKFEIICCWECNHPPKLTGFLSSNVVLAIVDVSS